MGKLAQMTGHWHMCGYIAYRFSLAAAAAGMLSFADARLHRKIVLEVCDVISQNPEPWVGCVCCRSHALGWRRNAKTCLVCCTTVSSGKCANVFCHAKHVHIDIADSIGKRSVQRNIASMLGTRLERSMKQR